MPLFKNLRDQKHQVQLYGEVFQRIQISFSDTRQFSFAEECRRQSLMLKNDPLESEINEWLDEVRDTKGWK